MNGEIIYFDKERGTGFISGSDGNRYVFEASDIATDGKIAKGLKIVFEADDNRARNILPAFKAAQLEPGSDSSSADAPSQQLFGSTRPSMLGYFRYCMTSGFAHFRGRAKRGEYWSFVVIAIIGFAIAGGLGFAAGTALGFNEGDNPTFSIVALILFWLCLLLPSLAVLVRRVHDIGLSGWFILLGLVPMFGTFIILVFALMPSQTHENNWGPVPTGAHV